MNEELKKLYHQCKTLQNTLEGSPKEAWVEAWPFVQKYNQLLTEIAKIDPDTAKLCEPIIIEEQLYSIRSEIGSINSVKVELNSLITHLEGYFKSNEEYAQRIINLIKTNLRKTFHDKPSSEKEVQNNVDIILTVQSITFAREKQRIQYSSKTYVPDFTLDNQGIAIEIKLCTTKHTEKAIIDEINADIQAYKTRYKLLIFVVYDVDGSIRDVEQFRNNINNDSDTFLEVIKH
jgi:hypothetical protein